MWRLQYKYVRAIITFAIIDYMIFAKNNYKIQALEKRNKKQNQLCQLLYYFYVRKHTNKTCNDDAFAGQMALEYLVQYLSVS